MASTLTLDIYNILEEKIGKEEAKKVTSAIEIGFDTMEKRAEEIALQKKLELRDELTKELATKADLLLLETKLEARIDKVKTELSTKFNFMIVLMILALTLMNPVVADILKSWLVK